MRLLVALLVVAVAADASADDSKLAKEGLTISPREMPPSRVKECCGYPLAEPHGFALRFYWLAFQDKYGYLDEQVDLYTPKGDFLGAFSHRFYRSLRMEGSGILSDGRVVNYAGRCRYGAGTCFEQLDAERYPAGRGAGRRALVPFQSVAVDPRLIPIGEPLYVPELDGLTLPNGEVHDGCVRADDTGGGIKKRKMDFFVAEYAHFRSLLVQLGGEISITPHIESPRCVYLRRR